MDKIFSYAFSTPCSYEQFFTVAPKLEKLGYLTRPEFSKKGEGSDSLVTNYSSKWFGYSNGLSIFQPIKLEFFNENVVLALAAATQGDIFYKDEWVICTSKIGSKAYIENEWYQIREDGDSVSTVIDSKGSKTNGWAERFFRKPSAQEIIDHFSLKIEDLPDYFSVECDTNSSESWEVCKYYGDIGSHTTHHKYVFVKNNRDIISMYSKKSYKHEIIPFSKWQELIKKQSTQMEQKIIGYKLKKDIPMAAAGDFSENILGQYIFGRFNYSSEFVESSTEWFEPIYKEQSKTLVLGSNSIKVEIFTDHIKADNKNVGILELKHLVSEFGKSIRTSVWKVFIDKDNRCIIIGCSTFSLNEIQQVIDTYNELNK